MVTKITRNIFLIENINPNKYKKYLKIALKTLFYYQYKNDSTIRQNTSVGLQIVLGNI